MKRALISAGLNLVEGNGRQSKKERRRFFEIATSSISEVAGCLDWAQIFGLMDKRTLEELKSELRVCYAMIRKLP